ncbi:MAG: GDP-mannose 4,6-dehydratase, partial [Kiritimatiellae bacterium]|nr:GDP-mannose 4,6-dehydratase [Kiritimatiellia bacterium]
GVRALVRETRPDAAVHLAALSFVPDGDRDPSLALSVNIAGTLNLADAMRAAVPAARLLFVSSAQVYGTSPGAPGGAKIDENAPVRPLSLYAVTKAACEAALLARHDAYGQDVVVVRPGNHTGPGQSDKFVVPSFARQALAAARGGAAGIRTGNLDSVRDFSDVRDIVRAYRLLLEKGRSGAVYNASSGARESIGGLLARVLALAGADVPAVPDPSLWRPTDRCADLDSSRLARDVGWAPEYTLDRTLSDLVESLRGRL